VGSNVVFDLDGTLVDTREAVRLAYAAAGATMPEWAWGRPWHQWLFDSKVHARKNELYPEYIQRYAQALPLLQVALDHDVPVITGASVEAVRAIRARFGPISVVLNGAGLQQKIDYLNWRAGRGTYVDDDVHARAEIERRTRWEALSQQSYLQRVQTYGFKRSFPLA